MLDVLIGLILVGLGFAAGRRSRLPVKAQTSEPEVRERMEDRMAFHQLMGYNVDCAYGKYEE